MGQTVLVDPLADEVASDLLMPDEALEEREMKEQVRHIIKTLPDQERMVVSMYYISGYAHKEISLDVPASTVKSRLYSARQRLKKRMLYMVEDHLDEQAPSKDHTFRDNILAMIKPDGMDTPEWIYYGYEAVDGNDAWSLMCASAAGDLKTVKALLKKDPRLIHAGFWYQFPLHMAVRKGHLEVVRVLLDAGSEPGKTWFLAYAWEKPRHHLYPVPLVL